MRVCMLTTGFPRFEGDLFGSFILELAKELVFQGVDVEVVAPHEASLPDDEEMDGVRVKRFRYIWPVSRQAVAYGGGIPTNLANSWITRLQIPFFLFGFWLKALGAVRRCDLVHCHWTISGLVAYLAARWCGRPIALSVRGSDIHLMKNGFMRRLNRVIYGRMDIVVGVSEDIAGKLEGVGVEKEKIRVVYNGVAERFQPGDRGDARSRLQLPPDKFILLFVGLLVPVKGLEVLLEAVKLVGDARLLCVLVGEGSQREELKKKGVDEGISEQLVFAGRSPSQEIPLWMNGADLLVLPSYSEGRPNVVLEAQACGLPVIATRVGGTPELIQDENNGLLIESGNPGELALKIAELMKDEKRRKSLGEAGRESIAQRGLTWEESARRMTEIYREVLSGTTVGKKM